jgi:hypothetical protein
MALATTRWQDRLTPLDYELLLCKALVDLQARGFNIDEARKAMRRFRIKMVDPADREAKPRSRLRRLAEKASLRRTMQASKNFTFCSDYY